MPDITIADGSSLSVAATLFDNSVIGKTPASVLQFLRSDVIGVMNQPLDKVQFDTAALGFSYRPSFLLEGGTAKLKAGGGPGGEVDLYKPGPDGKPTVLFAADRFGAQIDTGTNCYLALAFQLAVGASDAASPAQFALELEASATASAKLFLPFAASGDAYPPLKQALEELLSAYHLPSTLDDASKLRPGAGFVFEARGTVHFEAKFDVLAAINPTATPGIVSSLGPVSIAAGPSVTIGGKFSLSGDFQVRMWKKSDSVLQLAYYKKQGSSLAISFDASTGIDAEVGSFDVIAKIYGLLGDSGKLNPAWISANVPKDIADQVEDAYEAAVQTSLSIGVDGELDASSTDQAAFVWDFELSAVDADSHQAFAQAIQGDISSLVEGKSLPPGVTRAGSVIDRLKDSKHALVLNFLGLLDHANVQEFITRSVARTSEDGQLVLTDTEHLTRLESTATPFVKSDQLRRVVAEDCFATVAYAASLGAVSPQLKVAFSYYVYKDQLQPEDLQTFLAIANQLDVQQANTDWTLTLQGPFVTRPGSFFASLSYDPATSTKLFLDAASNPRSVQDFENTGRAATAATPGLIPDDQFRELLNDNKAWLAMRDAGSIQHFYQTIGVDQVDPPAWAVIAFTLTQHITQWASDMHATAQELQAVLDYAAAHKGNGILHDDAFLNLRQVFAARLKTAIEKTPLFNDSQGLITLYLAAAPASKKVDLRYGVDFKEYI